jgi:hypothetical protein
VDLPPGGLARLEADLVSAGEWVVVALLAATSAGCFLAALVGYVRAGRAQRRRREAWAAILKR